MSVAQALRDSTQALASAGIDTARLDSEVLLAHSLSLPRLDILSRSDRVLAPDHLDELSAMIARRAGHEPVAYITGQAEFWSLSLQVTPDVLIPRADSEVLVEAALERISKDKTCTIADLGTGSGCLSLAILSERPKCVAHALDISPEAVAVASGNASKLGSDTRFFVREEAMETWLGGHDKVDLLISNPPYINSADYEGLSQTVKAFEPQAALLGGEDGLDFYRLIARHAAAHLNSGGSVIVEIGHDQASDVQRLFKQSFRDLSCLQDLAGRDRVIIAENAVSVGT